MRNPVPLWSASLCHVVNSFTREAAFQSHPVASDSPPPPPPPSVLRALGMLNEYCSSSGSQLPRREEYSGVNISFFYSQGPAIELSISSAQRGARAQHYSKPAAHVAGFFFPFFFFATPLRLDERRCDEFGSDPKTSVVKVGAALFFLMGVGRGRGCASHFAYNFQSCHTLASEVGQRIANY